MKFDSEIKIQKFQRASLSTLYVCIIEHVNVLTV